MLVSAIGNEMVLQMRRLLFLALVCGMAQAQTVVTVDPTTTIRAVTQRPGISIGTPTSYDGAHYFNNVILPQNAGGTQGQIRELWQIFNGAGSLTTTTFNTNNTNGAQFDQVPANFFAGAKFEVVQSCSNTSTGACTGAGAELGCTGTIASNTVTSGTSPFGATYTINATTNQGTSGCAAAFAVGDVVLITQTMSNSTLWSVNAATTGAATIALQQADVTWCGLACHGDLTGSPSTTGSTYLVDTTGGGTATLTFNSDNLSQGGIFINRFRVINGAYQFHAALKCVTGTCTVTPQASRSGGFACNISSPTSWTATSGGSTQTLNCTASEGAGPGAGNSNINVNFAFATGGKIEATDLYFGPQSPTSGTVITDAYFQSLQTDMNSGAPGNPGTLRYNPNPSSETMDSWILPNTARMMTNSGTAIEASSFYTNAEANMSLQDHLALCIALQVDPLLIVPATFDVTEWQNLIDFLYGSNATVYGAKRIALGGPSASGGYATVFNTIHLEQNNESWNTGFTGFSLGPRISTYQDYQNRFATIAAAARAMPSYSSKTELIFNYQTASAGSSLTGATGIIAIAHPDALEGEEYTQGQLNDYTTTALLFQPALSEAWINMNNTTDTRGVWGFYHGVQALSTCGAGGATLCKANFYEWNNGTESGEAPQSANDGFADGAAYGTLTANQIMQNILTGNVITQDMYQGQQYIEFVNGLYRPIFGTYIDNGGACTVTNATASGGVGCRNPTMWGFNLASHAIIGPMIGCSISGATGSPTYNVGTTATATSISSTTSTVTVIAANTFQANQWIKLTGTWTSTVGAAAKAANPSGLGAGQYMVTSATSSQYTFAFTNAGFGSTSETGTATTTNNSVANTNSIPTLYSYCFQSESNPNTYAVMLVNQSLTTSYPFTFAGAGAPTTATVTLLTSTNPTDTNRAAANGVTNTVTAVVTPTVTTGVNVSGGYTVPPFSTAVLAYTLSTTTGGSTMTGGVKATSGTSIQ